MTEQKKSKALHIALWIVQILLAVAFGMAGFMKIITPVEQLAEGGMTFVADYGMGMVRFIGIVEVLGAVGLILPAALRIRPVLTPLAAVGIAIIMVLATYYHISNSEPIMATVVLFVLAVFVAWGRFLKSPIQSK
jgi:putative oxidoreductase